MSKRLDHIEAAKKEAERLGASISFKRGKKHILATVIFNNKSRKLSMSGTPRKMCSYPVVDDIRRLIREMSL